MLRVQYELAIKFCLYPSPEPSAHLLQLNSMFDMIDVERKYPPLSERDQWGGFDCIYRFRFQFRLSIQGKHQYRCLQVNANILL